MFDKMSGTTPDLTESNIKKLRQLFPEIIVDGKIDFEKLQLVLGKEIDDTPDRYNFTWYGKKKAMQFAQQPSKATLRPVKEKSKNWNTTGNIYIEGDNLEVLKLLQKSYNNKVKMIYIDPPYNTGNDFVYKDDFKDSVDSYLELTGQKDNEGIKFSSNTESNGRYHTDWLNMMYSRLKLARNLLKEDGVIFISIDDNEITNLDKLTSEVFGENNRISIISNISNPKGRSDSKFIASGHEYILMYAKNIDKTYFNGFELEEHITKRYNKIDEDGRKYRETDLKKGGFGDRKEDRPAMFYYFIYDKNTGAFYPSKTEVEGKISIKPIRTDGTDGRWRWGFDNAVQNINNLLVRWMPTKNYYGVFEKDYLDKRTTTKAPSYWNYKDINNERGVESFINYGFPKSSFDNPKPIGTINRLLKLVTNKENNDIILDFFSGSATTAEAVMRLNAEKMGNRKFIMVQLPEILDEKSEAFNEGYRTICDIGEERIHRAGEKIRNELIEKKDIEGMLSEDQLNPDELDIGFKVFSLDSSNLNEWQADFDNIESNIDLFENNFVDGRSEEDVLYEIIIKNGLDLTYPINEVITEEFKIYDVAFGNLFICLNDKITRNVAHKIVSLRQGYGIETSQVVFKDNGFENDTEKLNCYEILKDAGYQDSDLLSI